MRCQRCHAETAGLHEVKLEFDSPDQTSAIKARLCVSCCAKSIRFASDLICAFELWSHTPANQPATSPQPPEQVWPTDGRTCSECHLPQFKTPSGWVCLSGHGGVPSVEGWPD